MSLLIGLIIAFVVYNIVFAVFYQGSLVSPKWALRCIIVLCIPLGLLCIFMTYHGLFVLMASIGFQVGIDYLLNP